MAQDNFQTSPIRRFAEKEVRRFRFEPHDLPDHYDRLRAVPVVGCMAMINVWERVLGLAACLKNRRNGLKACVSKLECWVIGHVLLGEVVLQP